MLHTATIIFRRTRLHSRWASTTSTGSAEAAPRPAAGPFRDHKSRPRLSRGAAFALSGARMATPALTRRPESSDSPKERRRFPRGKENGKGLSRQRARGKKWRDRRRAARSRDFDRVLTRLFGTRA